MAEFVDRPPEVVFIMLDENGDGKLSLTEFAAGTANPGDMAAAKKLFQQKDKDHDGFLSLWEYLYDPADARFWALDRDGDGYVSLDEFLAAGRETGKRSPAEERQGKLPAGRTREAFAAMDLNHDGKLSLTEFRAALKKIQASKQAHERACAACQDQGLASLVAFRSAKGDLAAGLPSFSPRRGQNKSAQGNALVGVAT